MKYPEYKNPDYAKIAQDILAYWQEHKIFQKSVDSREGKPSFTFYEGPPSANGTPGIHHVMARTIKDIFCRFKTLQGFQVKRKGGWDTHGLPVELQVEKQLGITKEDIGKKISIEEYNRKCKEAVMKYKGEWDALTQQMGYWVDLDDPYITFEKDYMETLWYLLKQLYDKGFLYKGYTIQPYSPADGTGLSSHELNQPGCYRNVKDTSLTGQFKIKGTENDYLLAWTTTPWTLPANSGIAVGEKIEYVKVKTFNPYTFLPVNVILAKDRMDAYFNPKAKDLKVEDYKGGDKLIPYEVIDSFPGKKLVGVRYEQLMPYVPLPDPAFTVIAGDFVTTEDGSGLVHLAKTFGADDFRTLEQHGIPGIMVKDENGKEVPIVNKRGRFVAEITDFADMPVKNYDDEDENDPDYKSTDVKIAIKLKEENKAFKVEKYEHSYPHSWRTDKPILYYPLDSWFIKTTAAKERLVALNKTINWKPESTGTGRFGNWLENLVDWNLSRSRFWGTPLPIWRTEDGSEEKCIGSVAELKEEIEKANAAFANDQELAQKNNEALAKEDLHRPYVDHIVLVSESGERMYREPDLIDVWFDSGAMPYAQWHYPFGNKEIFDANYPADFISEGVDQTRGWFFTLHAIAGLLFDSVAFKNVVSTGLVLDKNGNKMSKRLGNAVDPFKTLGEHGPDATRWYMISNANPWDNLRFDIEGVKEVQRRFFGTLQNTYAFFALYANIDGFKYTEDEVPLVERTESDRWIISKLNSLIKQVETAYSEYEPTRATRLIQDFTIDDLSNWYVRLNRKRFWQGEYDKDKQAAYQTLYTCLITIAKLASPVAPFYMERLYKDLDGITQKEKAESIHLTDFPVADDQHIDTELEVRMQMAQTTSSLVHSLRKQHTIKVRQPLSKVLIPVLNNESRERLSAMEKLILSEVNVKEIAYIDDASGVLVKKIKPNFRKLGKTYGPKMKEISAAVAQMGQEDINQLERENRYALKLSDQSIVLTEEDVEISSEDIPGWSVAKEGNITVALDITVTDVLKKEGLARDLVNRIQNLRKDMGLDVQDKIRISIEKNEDLLNESVQTHKDYICTETQALSLNVVDQLPDASSLDLDDQQVRIKIEA
ncbi:isoleucine--tRNA ligase [Catalinimonas niigatensis]|uniref:isoleucine--tRNA ligase n=1 Tax=Catalinimonas niigatensis TaxID=1397264 RepID=UPI0026667490|nr:isoleucine--tRNA ligase [Catalinimonas niigatensis]WPP48584.1 isoleucine--tRNA ligase [Catalinimonas niigatensis]